MSERFPGAELFVVDGELDAWAHHVWRRSQADLMYLGLRPQMPRQEAADAVCERFGHERKGTGCMRCGRLV